MTYKRLIVTADDFGLTEGINDGIVEAHSRGIVTRASIIANGEAFEHAVLLSKQFIDLKIGIHLTLVAETPINQPDKIKSLIASNGKFVLNYKAFLSRYIMRKITLDEVYLEWESQIQEVLNSGININHIDSHQHLHMLPGLFNIAVALAHKYQINKIRMLHHDIVSIQNFKALILTSLSFANKKKIKRSGIAFADNFLGLKYSGHLDENIILKLLYNIPAGTTEMMCHPGYADNIYYQKYTNWNYEPDIELKALVSKRVKEKIISCNIKLIS
jgi:hopanoid biosynthesis associated protein HpnK